MGSFWFGTKINNGCAQKIWNNKAKIPKHKNHLFEEFSFNFQVFGFWYFHFNCYAIRKHTSLFYFCFLLNSMSFFMCARNDEKKKKKNAVDGDKLTSSSFYPLNLPHSIFIFAHFQRSNFGSFIL